MSADLTTGQGHSQAVAEPGFNPKAWWMLVSLGPWLGRPTRSPDPAHPPASPTDILCLVATCPCPVAQASSCQRRA